MGADGGSIPDRRDLVKTKGKGEQTDKALQRERFFLCALSKKRLTKPVVADPLGKLYNKDAILEYLIDKTSYGDGDEICRYVKGVKDLLTLNLMPNPAAVDTGSATSIERAPFVCWLSLKEMTGAIPFVALKSCGCVFSDAAIRAIVPNLTRGLGNPVKDDAPAEEVPCPNCGKTFNPILPSAVLPIVPSPVMQDLLLEALLVHRAATKANKKRKAAATEEKGEAKGAAKEGAPAKAARTGSRDKSDSPAAGRPTKGAPTSVGRSVQDKLAEQEKKRLAAHAGMSDAVKAMFAPKVDPDAGKSQVTDFFGRTFTRYA